MAGAEDLIRRAVEKSSQGGGGGNFTPTFKLPKHNDYAIVRFLEERSEFAVCYVHELRLPGKRPTLVPCLDQDENGTPCPGCESSNEKIAKRTFKGWINLIRYDAPQLKRGPDGRGVKENGEWVFEGTAPEVQVWERGITVFEELVDMDIDYKGLRSRPFKITRKGADFNNTKYVITPADIDSGPVAFSADEEKLAEKKYDLTPYTRIPSYEEAAQQLGLSSNGGGVTPTAVAESSSPFGSRASRFLEN